MRRSTLAASDKKMKKHKKKGSKKSTTRNIKRPRGSEAVYVIFCFFFQLFVAGSWNVERWRRCFIDGVERLSSSHRSGRILSSHGRLLYRVSIAFCFVFFYVVGLSNWLPPPISGDASACLITKWIPRRTSIYSVKIRGKTNGQWESIWSWFGPRPARLG